MHQKAEQAMAIERGAEYFSHAKAVLRLHDLHANVQRGFTLTELISIMVIIGILAAVALPRFFDANTFQARGTADQVKAALRYAQKVAIAQRRTVSANISAAANSDCGVALVGGNVNCLVTNSVPVVPAPPAAVTFDSLGRPVPNVTTTLTVGATTITIEAETGYVH